MTSGYQQFFAEMKRRRLFRVKRWRAFEEPSAREAEADRPWLP